VGWIGDYVDRNVPKRSPFLMAGDFNDWRETITARLKKRIGTEEAFQKLHRNHARTFPSTFPMLRLDRIYFRGMRAQEATRVNGRPWHLLSDHLPLIAQFEA